MEPYWRPRQDPPKWSSGEMLMVPGVATLNGPEADSSWQVAFPLSRWTSNPSLQTLVLRKMIHLHSYPVRTSRDTAACEAVAPSGPARSILLALLWTGHATGGDTSRGETCKNVMNYTEAAGWLMLPSEMLQSADTDGLGVLALTGVLSQTRFVICVILSLALSLGVRQDDGCGCSEQHQNVELPVLTPRRPVGSQNVAEAKGLSKQRGSGTFCHPTHGVLVRSSPSSPTEAATYPSPQDLVDGRAFFQRALSDDLCSHFLHIQHERVKRFLYVGLLLFFFLFGVLMLSGCRQNTQTQPNEQSQGPTSPQQTAHLLVSSAPKPSSSEREARFHFWSSPPWKMEQKQPGEGVGRVGAERDFVITSSSFTNTQFSQARGENTWWPCPPQHRAPSVRWQG